MRKLLTLIISLLFTLILSSCESTTSVTLPNLEGMSREEMKVVLDEAKVNYTFKFDYSSPVSTHDTLDKFVSYNGNLKAGDVISTSYQVYVYTTVLPLYPYLYKEVKMDFEYEGKSFIEDGVGVVSLVRATDGDTATFYDELAGKEFRLRFLGIDTPESTIEKDPWGKTASAYTKRMLTNAKEIVLEAEGPRTETYGRYLGFVWVDGYLLNLMIIEEAYSNSTLGSSKYEDVFFQASTNARKTGRRFFGEIDPNYDYDKKDFK